MLTCSYCVCYLSGDCCLLLCALLFAGAVLSLSVVGCCMLLAALHVYNLLCVCCLSMFLVFDSSFGCVFVWLLVCVGDSAF